MEHGLLIDETHLQVDLGVFGLTVGAEILVAQATRELVVAIDAGDHQCLLVELRALRKSVEFPLVDAAGNDVVPRAFRGGLDEKRGFHLEKTMAGEIVTRCHRRFMTQAKIALHLRSAQMQVAILQGEFLSCTLGLFQLEGKDLAAIENLQTVGRHFHGSRGHLGVHHIIGTGTHLPHHRDHILLTQRLRRVPQFLVFSSQHDLSHSVTVAEIDEDQASMISPGRNPSVESDRLSHLRGREFTAGMRPLKALHESPPGSGCFPEPAAVVSGRKRPVRT